MACDETGSPRDPEIARGGPASRAGAILDIDLAAVAANWRFLSARVAPAECAAVVKADAYGLGAYRLAPALAAAGCRRFFVATLDEGMALRGVLGPACEIAVFNGPFAGTVEEFVEHDLVPILNDPGQIALWRETTARCGPLPAMLHVDTGMTRLGLSMREFSACAEALRALPWRGLISHLACADEPLHPLNEVQRRRFRAARAALEAPASLAASSGIFLGPAFHCDFVRPGAALYGVNPQPGNPNLMRPVVRLKGRILQIREIDGGQSVGYGAAWTAPAPARLATVAVGYADGWLRSFGRRGSGRLGGVRVPLVGRISMDLTVFDVTAVDPALARPGAFVTLLDEEYGVDAAAAAAGTIGYEILTSLGRRYHRVYRESPQSC
ncbi:MAG TPA: alanine racemase [Stellaceae bacterium]|nr:alanine racemase [Stellaceae bacterium]